MQLTSLEIFGFKSFAERTKFVFDEGITGIVGPNGCGKSNVVDSIRWVLGEQKTRNLRSDKMENIIFNGTKGRRKSNFAEVSLTFENTKNVLPTEYTSVTITRKLYRSGDSEYQINGITCRLKDIQNLFMDTGISSDSYAIIELRMVDEMLANKDNERRKFFEEAAGISKYKIRKKQTLKRLDDTQADLERVEDLLFEIEKNLRSLEKQARRTQRYFELKEEYKQISSQYAILTMMSIRDRQQQIEVLQTQLVDQLTQTHSEIATREARLQDLKKTQVDQEARLSHSQQDLNQHIRKIQEVETEKSVKNERLKYLQQRQMAINNQLETERQALERNEAAVALLKEQQEGVNGELGRQEKLEQSLKNEVDQLRSQNTEQQQQLDSLAEQHRMLEQEMQHLIREKEVKKVQIQSLENELQRAEADKSQRAEDIGAFAGRTNELVQETEVLEVQANELRALLEQQQKDIAETEKRINSLKDTVYKSNRLLDAKQNEYNLTKSLVENLEGFPESVKFLKKNAKWIKNAPLLSDVFACSEEFKVAFENFLDPFLSYYVVNSREDAILSVHMLAEASKGRANFFVLDELETYKAENPLIFTQAQPALELVEFALKYRKLANFLLGQVYVVNNETEIPDDIPEGVVFLARAGNVSRRRFILSGGSLGLFEGKRLGRAKNLEKLDKEIGNLQKRLTAEKVQLDKAQAHFNQLKQHNYQRELEPVQRALMEKQRDLSVLQSREKEHLEFMNRVGQRSESLVLELDKIREGLAGIDPQLEEKGLLVQTLAEQLLQQRSLAHATAGQLNEKSQNYNSEHIRLIHLRNRFDNLKRDLEQKATEIQKYGENNDRLRVERERVNQDMTGLVQSNHQDDSAILELYDLKKEKEGNTERIEQQVAMTKNSIRQVEEALTKERRKREETLEKQGGLKETATEIRIELNSLQERMSVEFQVDLNELDEESLFDKPMDSYKLEEIEKRLFKVRGQVQSFGEINPMAVEAYNEMKERHDFITSQKNDLMDAKQSLLDTIAEIDATAQAKFLETFTEVRENFQKVFRSLFSEDDSCDLSLLDPENPLESEVTIIARPKGKRPLTIKQLSGGEKTLTAVALLFAIYLIKPAPFCVFDEVDAPLDDANIDKFNNIIRDFSKDSQFIIVTHNKRTMASTNVIYGVTMENLGISRVLPVDLDSLNLN